MKKSEVVFELVLHMGEPPELWSSNVLKTYVQVRNSEDLLWVLRAVDLKLWGLVGKARYQLVKQDDRLTYPLFDRYDTQRGLVWKMNSELIRFFQDEVSAGSRIRRKPKQLKLKLTTSDDAAKVHMGMVLARAMLAAGKSPIKENLDKVGELIRELDRRVPRTGSGAA